MLLVWICLGARLLVRRPADEGDSRTEEEMTNAKTFINFQTAASGNRRERQLDLTTTNPPPCSGRSSASRGAKKRSFEARRGFELLCKAVSDLQRNEIVTAVRSSGVFRRGAGRRQTAAALQKTIISLLDHRNFIIFVAEVSPRASASVYPTLVCGGHLKPSGISTSKWEGMVLRNDAI